MLGDTRRDLRLLPAVVGAWVAAWVAPLLPGQVVVGTCSVCLGIAVVARRKPTVVGALVVTAAMLALMGVRVFTLEHGPVFELAQQHRSVIATGVLTSDPAFVDQPGFAGVTTQVRVDVRLDQVTAGATSWQIRSPVFVMGDADGWRDLSFGSRVELRGTLAPNQGVSPMAAVLFTRGPPQTISPPGPLLRGAEQMRSGLRRAMTGTTDDAQGLLPGLVVGDTSALSLELKDDLRASGLTHLTAVSGANVAIVLVVVIAVARLVGFRGYAVPAVGLVAVGWFVVLARPQPSVLRAAVMGGLGVVAVVSAGRRRNPTLLLAALLLLLLLDPWLSRSWGFALSAAATAGLVLVAGRWRDRLARRWPEPLADGVAVALAAQVATLPLVVALSGSIPLLSVPANLLAAPAVAPATVLGAAAAAVSPVAPWLARALAWLGQWPAIWIAEVAHHTASAPLATLPWPTGWRGALLAVVLLGAGLLLTRWLIRQQWWSRRTRWIALLIVVVAVAALVRGPARWPPPGWLMVACDVGQGDGLVVATTPGHAMVVDVGPEPAPMDRCLSQLGVRQIDLLVLTHFHLDHVGGITGAMDGRSVGAVLVSPLADPPEQVDDVAKAVAGLPVVTASPGQSGDFGPVHWQVLWPTQPLIQAEGSAPNNASVVLQVETKGVTLLLAGDIEPPAQQAVLASGVDLASDVLKVPHHGSRNQDPGFWAAVHPRVAVVSVGVDNTYGHPDPGLLAAVEQAGILVGRTDQDGAVAVVVEDGKLRLVDAP